MLPSYQFSLLLLHLFLFASTYIVSSSAAKIKIGQGYKLTYIEEAPDGGFIGLLQLKQETSVYGPDIRRLQLYVKHETEDRLRVHITDAEKERWEVPYNLLPREKPPSLKSTLGNKLDTSKDSQFSGNELVFSYIPDPFSFAVKRKSNGETLFNSTSDESDSYSSLVFKDQYLEISTRLPSTASLYGLGENTQPKGIKLQPHDPYTLYTTDISAINLNIDLYGSHPVYLDLRNDGRGANAHAVLLLNSNGMDVFYTGKSLTYKVIGGVLDFYFFSGSTPLKVVDQYTSFAGRPAPMPYWALGFHQCRWGYHNVSQLESVVEGYRKANIPLDVMWTDDDHMDAAKDFTIDPINFPRQKFLPFVENLHANGLHYIVLIDPGIAVNQSYGVFRRGLADDVFIKHDGAPFLAQVWPGPVYFPDYLNPATVSWWGDEIRRFHELIPVDGLWIDMNEVSNFCTGQCKIPTDHPCPGTGQPWDCCLDCVNITKTRWDEPPYKINASGVSAPLGFKTIATSATHYNGVLEYNAHSLYGFTMAIATNKALLALQGKRPFVLSRSTFVGSGRYAAHWTGDNKGTWEDLGYSISTILNFGMFGVPMVGADICGFYPSSVPLEELCNRWIELGAFYPFSRDHANLYSPRQELYVWDSVAISARNALGLRYKLLPYFYTLNYEAHTTGAPIARPLFFNFPNFVDSYNVSAQFMLGRSVLVSPVLKKAATSVEAMFPPGSWYNLFDMSKAVVSKSGQYFTLEPPLHVVNVHLYQNNILPMQRGGLTSKEARTTPYSLVVTFPAGATSAEAKGELFVDEDELPEMSIAAGQSTYVEFYATLKDKQVKVWSVVTEPEYAMEKGWIIEKVTVLGLAGHGEDVDVEVDGVALKKSAPLCADVAVRHADKVDGGNYMKGMMVEIGGLELLLGKKFSMTWKMSIQ